MTSHINHPPGDPNQVLAAKLLPTYDNDTNAQCEKSSTFDNYRWHDKQQAHLQHVNVKRLTKWLALPDNERVLDKEGTGFSSLTTQSGHTAQRGFFTSVYTWHSFNGGLGRDTFGYAGGFGYRSANPVQFRHPHLAVRERIHRYPKESTMTKFVAPKQSPTTQAVHTPFSWLVPELRHDSHAEFVALIMDFCQGMQTCLELIHSNDLNIGDEDLPTLTMQDANNLLRFAMASSSILAELAERRLDALNEQAVKGGK